MDDTNDALTYLGQVVALLMVAADQLRDEDDEHFDFAGAGYCYGLFVQFAAEQVAQIAPADAYWEARRVAGTVPGFPRPDWRANLRQAQAMLADPRFAATPFAAWDLIDAVAELEPVLPL